MVYFAVYGLRTGRQLVDDERRWGPLEVVRLSCHAVRPGPCHRCARHACICIYQYYTTLPLAKALFGTAYSQ
jgi:hypothetical protein